MNIHEVVSQFQKIDHSIVGNGPKHPVSPNSEFSDDVEKFFNLYPKLKQDKGYVEFLEVYGGAAIVYPEYEFVLAIYGLTLDVVFNVLYPDESLVEEG